jgi:hypothetical protein
MAKQPEPVSKSGAHTVEAVSGDEPRSWSTKGDNPRPMLSYRLTVKDSGDATFTDVELAQLETSPAPKAGDSIEGVVNRRFYEWDGEEKSALQFKKAARGFGGGGGGRAYKPRPDDAPVVYAARQAQIVAQHSQDMALRVLELARQSGDDPDLIMATLGIPTTDESGASVGLVNAFRHDASLAAKDAWQREAQGKGIATALAALG